MTRFACALLSAGAALAVSSAAHAQSSVVGEDVANRAHPEYSPRAFPIGSFEMFPSVTVGANATDNLRATPTNKVGSAFLTVRPEFTARSNWSRHALTLGGFLDQVVHPKLTAENVTTFGGSLSGMYDISRQTQFQLNLSAARLAENRLDLGAFRGSTSPVKFDQFYGRLNASQGFGRFSTVLTGTVERRNYHVVRSSFGPIDQSFRDLTQYGASIDLKYDLGNGIGLIGSGRYNNNVYSFRPGRRGFVVGTDVDRSSYGYSVLGGFTLELSKLLFGSVRVGYMKQRYKNTNIRGPGGFTMDVDLLWNVTTLTSVRLRASRSVQDTSLNLPQIGGSTIRTDVGLGVNHELFRSVLLSADGSYGHFNDSGIGASGDEYEAGLGVRYLMNRNLTLKARVDHSERDSNVPNLRYKANRGVGSVGYAF